jgi:branched-chain amino acid transport system substrate-binding protein
MKAKSSRISRRHFDALAGSTGIGARAPATVRAQPRRLKVGVIQPRLGVLAQLGQSCQRGADLASVVIGERLGVELELMSADFESNPELSRSRAERLIDEGAQVLVGPFDSGAAAVASQVAEQRRVSCAINIAAAPQLTEQGYRFTFRISRHRPT